MINKFKLIKSEPHIENTETGECYDLDSDNFSYIVKIMNDLSNKNEQLQTQLSQLAKNNREGIAKVQKLAKENEKIKKSMKGQELEIVRLHHLADAMSGVLRELGIYDVYNKKQIDKVKKELQK